MELFRWVVGCTAVFFLAAAAEEEEYQCSGMIPSGQLPDARIYYCCKQVNSAYIYNRPREKISEEDVFYYLKFSDYATHSRVTEVYAANSSYHNGQQRHIFFYAKLDNLCILKDNKKMTEDGKELPFPKYLTLHSECPLEIKEGEEYVIGFKWPVISKEECDDMSFKDGIPISDKICVNHGYIIPATPEVLNSAVKLCDYQDVRVPRGTSALEPEGHCPVVPSTCSAANFNSLHPSGPGIFIFVFLLMLLFPCHIV
jgi:hypothetical protein